LEILVFASFIAEISAFFLVLFFGLAILFEKKRRPQWFKIFIWSVIFLFLNFFSCVYLVDDIRIKPYETYNSTQKE